jgi:murein DD-endopeptidase MepM/ murein hydrolase activator NlpD
MAAAPTVEVTATTAPTIEPTRTAPPTLEPMRTADPTARPARSAAAAVQATRPPTPSPTPDRPLEPAAIPTHTPGPTATPEPADARAGLIWPARGPITTYFGEVSPTAPRGHAGIDIAARYGSPILTAAAGQVALATTAGGGYGTEVIVDHGKGLRTLYAHLSQLDVAAGQWAAQGQLIGLVGSTGYSTGPHLHFEVHQNGELRDPLAFLP